MRGMQDYARYGPNPIPVTHRAGGGADAIAVCLYIVRASTASAVAWAADGDGGRCAREAAAACTSAHYPGQKG
jgi:hypothetical protein